MKKVILIVDDDEDIRFLYQKMLKSEFQIVEAATGEEGILLYKKYKPDLTIMDIRMPVMNGDIAIQKIKEFDPLANILAVTAFRYTEPELMVPVLTKGFSKDMFVQTINEFL